MGFGTHFVLAPTVLRRVKYTGSVMLVQKKKQVADYRESRKRHRDKGMGV